ncbi:recombinase family protein [Aliiglaciecola sp. 3_MG-2023]|uniref:recombinase family protein n=1 Tax=Aliiglaciecola sp. 3_MG-2023 TaxID=3062644 RepID=UPI0026E2872A|nr:recombinase family protein [Aliiglaciecola sp. 3_MG-2023]MDO6693824.1 recombinase family protein [Aliiglaciecola sp. 3_MG-2023]
MRAVVYARYSSDLQKLSSIDDQIAICTDFAKSHKFNIVRHFTDAAESGSSLNRAGINALLNCSKDFDIVICEALDRLSRDQADIANIFKQLSFSGIKIITLSEGEITSMHIGLKGTMNAMFLEELARKTKRGLKGKVEKGKSGGGKTYGYNVVKQFDSNGEPVRGEREINHQQAEIVNRIFNSYITENKSPKTIAAELNREGIPCPSGSEWGCSTIQGNRRRGTGILNNELYIGRLIWNRATYVKHPTTGKRLQRPNPESEWVITEVPTLQIVDKEVWEAAKLKQKQLSVKSSNAKPVMRPRHLLSQLIICEQCGSSFTLINKERYGCSRAKNKGTCSSAITVKKDILETTVIDIVKNELNTDESMNLFVKEYNSYMTQLKNATNKAEKHKY